MKISKSLLQAIAVAVVVGATVSACTKDNSTQPSCEKNKIENPDNCLACGRG